MAISCYVTRNLLGYLVMASSTYEMIMWWQTQHNTGTQWVGVTTLRYFSVIHDSYIQLFHAFSEKNNNDRSLKAYQE